MPEYGYGAPSSISPLTIAATYKDRGYGSPTPASITNNNLDTGYGSPTEPTALTGAITIQTTLIPDEGGWVIELVSANGWVDSLYKIRFIHSANQTAYPVDHDCFCAAGHGFGIARGTNPGECAPYGPFGKKDTMRFTSPSCPPGTYDLRLKFGVGFGQTLLIEDAFTVVNRNRCRPAVRGRSRLPSPYKTGPISIAALPAPSAPETLNPLEALTLSMGQAVQRQIGVPVTRLSSTASAGSATFTVETTLGFPSSGAFFCAKKRFTYTGTTSTSFTGVALSGAGPLWTVDITAPAEVVYDARAYQPVD